MRAVCVEVGGGSIQTVLFPRDGTPVFLSGAVPRARAPLLIAVPGLIEDRRVVAASNLGWLDVDPVERLGLIGPARVVCNDGEAAALGESVLRGGEDLAFVGLGTGVGGAIVRGGRVVASNLFGHLGGFGDRVCRCRNVGCLETVAAGWALPATLSSPDLEAIAGAIVMATGGPDVPALTVVAGGIAARYPSLIHAMARRAPHRRFQPSRAPAEAKSAAAWGLLALAGLEEPALPAPLSSG